MKKIEEKLRKILINYGINKNKISENSDYYFDLDLNMLDLISLARKIQKEFMISISDNEIIKMEKVSDTISLLEKKSASLFSNN